MLLKEASKKLARGEKAPNFPLKISTKKAIWPIWMSCPSVLLPSLVSIVVSQRMSHSLMHSLTFSIEFCDSCHYADKAAEVVITHTDLLYPTHCKWNAFGLYSPSDKCLYQRMVSGHWISSFREFLILKYSQFHAPSPLLFFTGQHSWHCC